MAAIQKNVNYKFGDPETKIMGTSKIQLQSVYTQELENCHMNKKFSQWNMSCRLPVIVLPLRIKRQCQ